ncbi:hypothetical protein MCOL2_19956 [Listeria fleischmannii FSL S10-1203]|uniref:Uncharacterized protein n=2 Tax=Listeria fleischmannii TaxID=1069827 RepID=W7CXE5_9LIST|nr:hypothetical protein MCOL2_19956 [Listeria fleischmannii FSL S10-1203]
MAKANLTHLALAREKHAIRRKKVSYGGADMLIGRHPSGLSVMIQYNGKFYVYQAKYNQGCHKNLELAKRLWIAVNKVDTQRRMVSPFFFFTDIYIKS